LFVEVHRDKLLDAATLAEGAEIPHKFKRLLVDSDGLTIEEDEVVLPRIELIASEQRGVFHTQIDTDPVKRTLRTISGNVSRKSEILDQPARFTFWGICGAQDTPVARLKSTGSGYLSSFLELRIDPSHHAQCGYI
jgi:hypothetical protein